MSIMSFFQHLIAAPGSGGLEAQAQEAQALASQKANAALEATADAKRRAELAATPVQDLESNRLASEAEMRRRLKSAGFSWSGASPLGAAPLGFNTLTGQ